MLPGDLVRFRNQEFFSFYGSGLITERLDSWTLSVLFNGEIVTARKEELELINASR